MQNSDNDRLKIALATNFIAPYRIELYQQLASAENWDFRIFISCDIEKDRKWDMPAAYPFSYKRSFSFSYIREITHSYPARFVSTVQVHIPIGLLYDLILFKPDVIISSEMGARSLFAAVVSCMTRTPLVLIYEGSYHATQEISLKQMILRKVLTGMATSFIAGGLESVEYLRRLGVGSDKIWDVKFATNIIPYSNRITNSEKGKIRNEYGLSGYVYLYVGSFIQRKGLHYLIDAWISSELQNHDATLLLVGNGPEKQNLRARIPRKNNSIVFADFTSPEKLPGMYQACDVFVFPTLEDMWGLVVNEAMASGLPVICSRYAGCAVDLIQDGINGWIVDPIDKKDMIGTLELAWQERGQKEEMGRMAEESVSEITINRMAEGMRNAVQTACESQM